MRVASAATRTDEFCCTAAKTNAIAASNTAALAFGLSRQKNASPARPALVFRMLTSGWYPELGLLKFHPSFVPKPPRQFSGA